jgi:hypothetical protein
MIYYSDIPCMSGEQDSDSLVSSFAASLVEHALANPVTKRVLFHVIVGIAETLFSFGDRIRQPQRLFHLFAARVRPIPRVVQSVKLFDEVEVLFGNPHPERASILGHISSLAALQDSPTDIGGGQ